MILTHQSVLARVQLFVPSCLHGVACFQVHGVALFHLITQKYMALIGRLVPFLVFFKVGRGGLDKVKHLGATDDMIKYL